MTDKPLWRPWVTLAFLNFLHSPPTTFFPIKSSCLITIKGQLFTQLDIIFALTRIASLALPAAREFGKGFDCISRGRDSCLAYWYQGGGAWIKKREPGIRLNGAMQERRGHSLHRHIPITSLTAKSSMPSFQNIWPKLRKHFFWPFFWSDLIHTSGIRPEAGAYLAKGCLGYYSGMLSIWRNGIQSN